MNTPPVEVAAPVRHPLFACLLRVRTSDGEVVGAAFLAADRVRLHVRPRGRAGAGHLGASGAGACRTGPARVLHRRHGRPGDRHDLDACTRRRLRNGGAGGHRSADARRACRAPSRGLASPASHSGPPRRTPLHRVRVRRGLGGGRVGQRRPGGASRQRNGADRESWLHGRSRPAGLQRRPCLGQPRARGDRDGRLIMARQTHAGGIPNPGRPARRGCERASDVGAAVGRSVRCAHWRRGDRGAWARAVSPVLHRRQQESGGVRRAAGDLDELDRWLADSETSNLLVAAQAGRGKSALLAHWALEVAETGRATSSSRRLAFALERISGMRRSR